MSKRAEIAALKAYPIISVDARGERCEGSTAPTNNDFIRGIFQQGYEQAEKDLADAAAFSSGPDGFYYGKGYQQGKKDAEKHLGLRSVKESPPPVDEEVIVLIPYCGDAAVKTQYEIAVAKLIQPIQCMPIGEKIWNIPGVKFWMPMPKIPEE